MEEEAITITAAAAIGESLLPASQRELELLNSMPTQLRSPSQNPRQLSLDHLEFDHSALSPAEIIDQINLSPSHTTNKQRSTCKLGAMVSAVRT